MRIVTPSQSEAAAMTALQEAIEDLVPEGHILSNGYRKELSSAFLSRMRGVDEVGNPVPLCKYYVTPWGRERKRRKSIVRRDT